MSGDGGDGGGDKGGIGLGDKGDSGPTGGSTNGYNGFSPTGEPSSASNFAPTSSGPSVSNFVSDPTGTGSTGSNDPFGVVNDPSQGNLTGPGPVTGSDPAAGSGSSSPFSFDNSSFMVDPNSFGGQPISSGVFDSGSSGVPNLTSSNVPGQSAFSELIGNTAATPGGTSAAGISAPASVATTPDPTSTELSSVNKPTGSTTGAGGTTPTSSVSSSLGGFQPSVGSAVAGAGLINSLVNGNNGVPYAPNLNSNAASANAVSSQQTSAGQALQQWQTTGTLPDSYESQVQRAAQDAKTRAISNAAAQGLPTDPTKNTALAQQLNAIDAAIPGQREAIASQLAQSGQQMVNAGLQASGISSGVYQTLANLTTQNNTNTGNAIANFASALNGGNKGVTVNLAK